MPPILLTFSFRWSWHKYLSCRVVAEHSMHVCSEGMVSVLRAPLHPVLCECQSKPRAGPHLASGTALPALLTVHLSGICSLSRNRSINPPAICIPLRCRSLPLTSLLLLELISLPPSCLRDASPLPQPISSGSSSASANERVTAESGNVPDSTPLSPLPPQDPGGRQWQRAQLNCSPLCVSKARLHILGSSVGSLLGLHSCRHGWEMRCIGWQHLKPEVFANQLWGFWDSSSPTWGMWMQVSSLIADSSACGKRLFCFLPQQWRRNKCL